MFFHFLGECFSIFFCDVSIVLVIFLGGMFFWMFPFLGWICFPFLGWFFFPFFGGGGDLVCSKMPNDRTSHQFGCVESLSCLKSLRDS